MMLRCGGILHKIEKRALTAKTRQNLRKSGEICIFISDRGSWHASISPSSLSTASYFLQFMLPNIYDEIALHKDHLPLPQRESFYFTYKYFGRVACSSSKWISWFSCLPCLYAHGFCGFYYWWSSNTTACGPCRACVPTEDRMHARWADAQKTNNGDGWPGTVLNLQKGRQSQVVHMMQFSYVPILTALYSFVAEFSCRVRS